MGQRKITETGEKAHRAYNQTWGMIPIGANEYPQTSAVDSDEEQVR